ncbi:MAG: APC family permease [Sulfolobaceae archaeon]
MGNGNSTKNEVAPGLAKNKVTLWGMIALSIAGIFLYGYAYATAGGFIDTAGRAAIYVGVLGAAVVLLASIPILEYARLVKFAGGYYGLAELGFGKAVGKFTALLNYLYYNFWQAGNSLITAMLMNVGYYIITGSMPPIWLFFVFAIVTATVMYIGAITEVSLETKVILISVIIQVIVVLASALYVIFRSPYNSLVFLNPNSGPGGFRGIALGASIAGFLTFIGYGNPLFYSEEGAAARKTVWKAIIISVLLTLLIGSISIYSELVALPNINTVASSPIPLLTAYRPYFGTIGLFFFWALFIPFYYTSIIGGAGSQARLLYAMARDKFFKSKWLSELHPKRRVPVHAALVNYIIALLLIIAISIALFSIYGYNETSMFYAAFATFTTAVILWYFHHFIPDISLYFYIQKHKIKVSLVRKIITAVITPAFGVIIFSYAFYAGIVSSLVEPYFSFVILGLLIAVFAAIYVVYKAKRGELGESVVHYFAAEAARGEE